MLIVHHLSNSHSHVILWLMEELGAPYEIVKHQRQANRGSPDSLRAVHRLGKAPTIVDQGVTMVESTGIILYLLEKYGEGRLRPPAGTPDAMRFLQWLTFMEGSVKGPLMALRRYHAHGAPEALKDIDARLLKTRLDLIDDALAGQQTIVPGLFTAADIQLTFLEELAEATGVLAPYPNMTAHLARMRQREGYKRAEAKGGPVGLTKLMQS